MPMKRASLAVLLPLTLVLAASSSQGCGARSELIACESDADCADPRDLCTQKACTNNRCVVLSHTHCDDGDACTTDSCDKKTGSCVFDHVTYDLDGDMHYAPKEGFDPGAPGSCGDDCDDTDPNAYPGNKEVCDGVDNDCDGIIDNGATYTPAAFGTEAQISELELDYAEAEHLTRGGQSLLAGYSASRNGQFSPESRLLDKHAKPTTVPTHLTSVDAAGSNSVAVWTGDRWGLSWSDRRDGNFEIYFAALDAAGNKLAPGDERITVSSGFSLYPSIAWSGQAFYLVWQEEVGDAQFTVQAQRIALDGTLLGSIASITPGENDVQGPVIAASRKDVGIAWVRGTPTDHHVMFRTFNFDMKPKATSATDVSTNALDGIDPQIAFNRTAYVVAFGDPVVGKRTVYASVVGPDGKVVVGATRVAALGNADARDVSLLALGDRVAFVYSDDGDNNLGYELYARTFAADLTPLTGALRVTNAPGDSIGAHTAFTSDGSLAVLFRDDRNAAPAVFATALACKIP